MSISNSLSLYFDRRELINSPLIYLATYPDNLKILII